LAAGSGVTLAVVETGAEETPWGADAVEVVDEPEAFDEAGEGETIAAVVAELDVAVGEDVAAGVPDVLLEVGVVDAVAAANGSREA
jgi:hypothetical protein